MDTKLFVGIIINLVFISLNIIVTFCNIWFSHKLRLKIKKLMGNYLNLKLKII